MDDVYNLRESKFITGKIALAHKTKSIKSK